MFHAFVQNIPTEENVVLPFQSRVFGLLAPIHDLFSLNQILDVKLILPRTQFPLHLDQELLVLKSCPQWITHLQTYPLIFLQSYPQYHQVYPPFPSVFLDNPLFLQKIPHCFQHFPQSYQQNRSQLDSFPQKHRMRLSLDRNPNFAGFLVSALQTHKINQSQFVQLLVDPVLFS